jgi:large subunit ribosomal protein L35
MRVRPARPAHRRAHRYPVAPPMPKMKTHSGAKKRFKVTASGKVQGRHAYSSHILEKKSPKRKRSFKQDRTLGDSDGKRAIKLLRGYEG